MRRTIKLLLAAVAILAVVCSGAAFADVTAKKTTGVKYRENGVEKTTPNGIDVYIIDDAFDPTEPFNMNKDWYVVSGDVTWTRGELRFTLSSSVINIILADGATLNTTGVIYANNVSTLTIYAQSIDRDKMGVISANVYDGSNRASIDSLVDITIHGGWIKARREMSGAVSGSARYAIHSGKNITVGSGAIVEAECIVKGNNAAAIFANGTFISSGDVTAKVTSSGDDTVSAINTYNGTAKIVGGVCRATASGSADPKGINAKAGVAVEGGWVESTPPIGGTTNHTGGALIDGDTGTVKGTAIIPAGMAATLPTGVTLTIPAGATLTVEDGATLDNKGTIRNDGVINLPAGKKVGDLGKLTGSGTVEVDGVKYSNSGYEYRTITVTPVTPGSNGTASADFTEAASGDVVKLLASPDVGYVFDEWVTVPTSLIITGREHATFTMPNEDVEIKATFKALPPSPTPDPSPTPPAPTPTQGKYNGAIIDDKTDDFWNARVGGDLTIHIDVDLDQFTQIVSLDGVPLAIDTSVSNDFGARRGSTIVTIWEKTLKEHIKADGVHTAEIGFADGTAIHTFTVRGTGETDRSSGGACASGAAVVVGLIGLAAIKRRKK